MKHRLYLKQGRNKKIQELDRQVMFLKGELKAKNEVIKILMDTRLSYLNIQDAVRMERSVI